MLTGHKRKKKKKKKTNGLVYRVAAQLKSVENEKHVPLIGWCDRGAVYWALLNSDGILIRIAAGSRETLLAWLFQILSILTLELAVINILKPRQTI